MTWKRALTSPRVEARFPWTPFGDEELDRSIVERFEKQVLAGPDRLAIRAAERTFTYDELNRAANRLARAILAKYGPGSEPIALLFDHGADALAAMIAALKAGKFYLVLDPQFPHDRLAYMLADSGTRLVVTDASNASLAARLSREGLATVGMHGLDESIPGENLDVHRPADALAMLLYTSGSTGSPKGVMHSHRNVLAEVRNLTNAWCLSAEDRWLLYTSLSFANSVRTIYGALLNGGSLYPYDLKKHGFASLSGWLERNRITIMRTLPTTFRNFAATLPPDRVFGDVRLLSIGGEPMYRSDVEAFNAHFAPSSVIAHGLGPTECFMVCLNYIPQGTHIDSAKLDIGSPLPDKEVLLVDESGREVAAGEVGEIWVKSRYIALGYWGDAGRTAASFRTDSDDPEVRIYKTGDMGTKAANGSFTHVGRRDFQVKIRGYRIDVSEIEAAMRAVDGVRDAVVVAQDWSGEKRLVAYFVASTAQAVKPARVRQVIGRALPEYMVPAAIERIEAIPQTPNGKTDRLRLAMRPRQRPQLDSPLVSPGTQIETDLVRVWSELLGFDEIGIHDDFFELGGDSLGAARVVAQILKKFDLNLPMKTFFQSPTVAQLAEIVARRVPAERTEVPPITRRDRSRAP